MQPELLIQKIAEAAVGRKIEIQAGGVIELKGSIFNEEDDPLMIQAKRAMHIGGGFVPGTGDTIARTLEAGLDDFSRRDLDSELTTGITGIRQSVLNVPESLTFLTKDHIKQGTRTTSLIRDVAMDGTATDQDIVAAYYDAEAKRRDNFQEMREIIEAAKRLRREDEAMVFRSLRSGGLGAARSRALVRGNYVPYVPTRRFMHQQIQLARTIADPVEREQRIRELVRRRNLLIRTGLRERSANRAR